ncbi:MAG: ATP-binding protein [Bacteroidota bacterium]
MKRAAYNQLLEWKNNPGKKPLIIQGARQVGKTWLMREFGKNEFPQTVYFNFETNKALHAIFKSGIDTEKIISSLGIIAGFTIDPDKSLIILDEIQACPEAITALKYFQENSPSYNIFAAGSLLGVAIHGGLSFPVGKVDFLTVYPLDFHEFLEAMSQAQLLKAIESGDTAMVENFNDQLIELLKQYYFVGGMPEAVSAFIKDFDYHNVRQIQNNILIAYENDFSKHAPVAQLPRIRLVWQSIIGQLAKENSKFIYSILRKGSRAKEFELAIEWLKDAGLIQKVIRVKKPGLPINAYADWADFKIYMNDIGLMCALGDLSAEIILSGHELFKEFKGAISEQFVLQQLIVRGYRPYYWAPDNSQTEIDFLIQRENQVVPIEVKSAENLKSRSLRSYYDRYQPNLCIRTSLAGFKTQDWMQNIPLYFFHQWLRAKQKGRYDEERGV